MIDTAAAALRLLGDQASAPRVGLSPHVQQASGQVNVTQLEPGNFADSSAMVAKIITQSPPPQGEALGVLGRPAGRTATVLPNQSFASLPSTR